MSDTAKRDAVLARHNGGGLEYPVYRAMAEENLRLRAENIALAAAVERVRALHESRRVGWSATLQCCSECNNDDNDYIYPCPTLRALEGTV